MVCTFPPTDILTEVPSRSISATGASRIRHKDRSTNYPFLVLDVIYSVLFYVGIGAWHPNSVRGRNRSKGVHPGMKMRFPLILLGLAVVVAAFVILSTRGTGAKPFVDGVALLPAPEGGLVAIEERSGQWAVYTPDRERVGGFASHYPPLWLIDGLGETLVSVGENGLEIKAFGDGGGFRTFPFNAGGATAPRVVRPVQALEDGRILLACFEDKVIRGFSIWMPLEPGWNTMDAGRPEFTPPPVHELAEGPARFIRASMDGKRVSYSVEKKSCFTIFILCRTAA